MLFNTYINDMFFALNETDIFNFADDTKLKSVLEKLEHNSELAIAGFEIHYMKLKTDKCRLLISRNKNKYMWAKLDGGIVCESNDVELLGVAIDNNLRFDKHVFNICLKANRKLSALTTVTQFVPFKKRCILFKALYRSTM